MIRWILERLGTAPYGQFAMPYKAHIVDVRDMVDQGGNAPDLAMAKVDSGVEALRRGETVVVCCDYGISRSNAIAAGILAKHEGLRYDAAVARVMQATGEFQMQISVVGAVRAGLEGQAQSADGGRLLVSGASGLLGTALRTRLGTRADWIAPARDEANLLEGSVGLDLVVQRERPRAILHLANPRIYTLASALGDSLTMLKNVIDVCVANGIRLIYPSSWEVFSGYRSQGLMATPDLARNPHGTYGEAKLLAETLLEHSVNRRQLRLTMMRSSPIYGMGDKPKFIHHFIAKALRSETIYTHRYRNGFPRMDLLHIDDAVALLERVCDAPRDGVIHMGTGFSTTTADVARMVVDLTNSASKIDHRDIDAYSANISMDVSETQRCFGWQPAVSLTDGLAGLVALHRSMATRT